MQLFTVIESLIEGDTIGMYSVSMLPKNFLKLKKIFDAVEKKNCSFYFILEAKKIYNLKQAKSIIFLSLKKF